MVTYNITPCAAELFASIFHSFKDEIANAISSFEWPKIAMFIMFIRHLQYWILGLTIYQKYFFQIEWYFYLSKTCLNLIYTGLAAQGLKYSTVM